MSRYVAGLRDGDASLTDGQTLLNPFHTAYTPIRSPAFDARVRMSAKKYL